MSVATDPDRPPFPAAILFDLDGLLVDSEPVWHRAERDLATSLGTDWPDSEARACIGVGLRGTCERLMARAGLQADVTVLVDGLITRFLARTAEIMPKPGALRIVTAAVQRRVPIAVATSSPERVATRVLASTGLLPHFGALAFGDEVAALKPSPAVYLLSLIHI